MENKCVACGAIIPEGRQVCPTCERGGVAQESRWISVKDRLPEEFVSVLVYMPEEAPLPTVREGYLSPCGFMVPALLQHVSVTHWMPLPEPPKEAGK